MKNKWWQEAIIYQIYPKSFYDSNNDGIGDIQGVIEKLPYLKKLGVNALWLNPIFSSPQVDNGYDIDDYESIDPLFGTMEDVEAFIEQAHQQGMKVIFDFVLNHTSDQHPWFQKALADKNSKYNDYYYFMDEKPNNWASFFGGSVWERTKDGRYYFHLFDKKMPDLNWSNPEVREKMMAIAQFWANKGIDGLRLDAFIHLGKADFSLQKEGGDPIVAEEYYAHLNEVHQYMQEFNTQLKQAFPQLFFVGEASSASLEQAVDYMKPERHECDSVITFRYFEETEAPVYKELSAQFQPKVFDWQRFAHTMDEWQEKIGRVGYPTLYFNNHDMARMVNRFGSLVSRKESQKCLATLMYLQKGIPILLYGEEIGMENHHAQSIDDIEENEGIHFYNQALDYGLNQEEILSMMENHTRNASRGAMQWDDTKYAGFSTHQPWLGVNVEKEYNVAAEEKDEHSILNYYRQLLSLKKEPLYIDGVYHRLSVEPVYAYTRENEGKKATIYCNLSEKRVTVQNKGNIRLGQNIEQEEETLVLGPWASVVIEEDKNE